MRYVSTSGFGAGMGSSAITDLLLEYDEVNLGHASSWLEHVLFFMPDSLPDLEYKCFDDLASPRADEAVMRFYERLRWYDEHILVSELKQKEKDFFLEFSKAVDQFVDEITMSGEGLSWLRHKQKTSLKSLMLQCVKNPVKWLVRGYVPRCDRFGKSWYWEEGNYRFLTADRDQFYRSVQKLTGRYAQLMADDTRDTKILMLDALADPHYVKKIPFYFDHSFRFFFVWRDPRDVYLINKYFWKKRGSTAPYPENAKDFCRVYRTMTRGIPVKEDQTQQNCMYLPFEDLVYQYDKTVQRIESFLDLSKESHRNRSERFVPENSINNTQLYQLDFGEDEAVQYIERELSEYLYHPPIQYVPNFERMFDGSYEPQNKKRAEDKEG